MQANSRENHTECNWSIGHYRVENMSVAIDWFREIEKEEECTFMLFDIVEFYPSISGDLPEQALQIATTYTDVTEKEVDIIYPSITRIVAFCRRTSMDEKRMEMACLTLSLAVSMASRYVNWWEHLCWQR